MKPRLFLGCRSSTSDNDNPQSIAIDSTGSAYVAGATNSSDFPTTVQAFQPTAGGGPNNAFVTKLNPSGTGLVYSTYLGGSGNDVGIGLAVDSVGNAYVTGWAASTNFPTTAGAFQATSSGGNDAFVTVLNTTGSGLVYSSYLGGTGDDRGLAIAVDALPNPNAYITGATSSANFPTSTGAFQTTYAGGYDAFVSKIANLGPTVGKVTGDGTINLAGGIGNFGFIVQANTDSVSGDLQYVNHATGEIVHSLAFTSFGIVGNTVIFGGPCTDNCLSCTFTVNATDNGEPGTNDAFTISVNGGPLQGGTLRSGKIKIH